jgi:hypothetical protein
MPRSFEIRQHPPEEKDNRTPRGKACADAASKQPFEFPGIVIWRIADRQAVERQAYLQKLLAEQA